MRKYAHLSQLPTQAVAEIDFFDRIYCAFIDPVYLRKLATAVLLSFRLISGMWILMTKTMLTKKVKTRTRQNNVSVTTFQLMKSLIDKCDFFLLAWGDIFFLILFYDYLILIDSF